MCSDEKGKEAYYVHVCIWPPIASIGLLVLQHLFIPVFLKTKSLSKLTTVNFFQWKVWFLTHICITADNIANAFKEIWTQVVAVRYKKWGLSGCANIDNTIKSIYKCYALHLCVQENNVFIRYTQLNKINKRTKTELCFWRQPC